MQKHRWSEVNTMNNCRRGATPAPQFHLASPVAAEAQQFLELQGLIWRPSLSQSNCTGAKVFPVAIMGSECHMDLFHWMLLKNWFKLNKQMFIKVLCHCKSKFTFLGVSFQVQESLVAGGEALVWKCDYIPFLFLLLPPSRSPTDKHGELAPKLLYLIFHCVDMKLNYLLFRTWCWNFTKFQMQCR